MTISNQGIIIKKPKSAIMKKSSTTSKAPELVTLENGPFTWCTCGKSSRQPFCDGTHRQTKFIAVSFKIPASREAWLCSGKKASQSAQANKKQSDPIANGK